MGKRIVTWLGFGVLFFVPLMSISVEVCAQGKCFFPSGVGQALNDLGSVVKAYSTDDEISPAAPVNVWVDAGGFGRPPYQWQVTGMGYTLSASTTNGDFIPVTLSVVGGTCGTNYAPYATVTVTDDLDVQDSIVIRNTGGGWYYLFPDCRYGANGAGGWSDDSVWHCETYIKGMYRWKYSSTDWIGQNKSCAQYPGTWTTSQCWEWTSPAEGGKYQYPDEGTDWSCGPPYYPVPQWVRAEIHIWQCGSSAPGCE